MKLGELISALKRCEPEQNVMFDFGRFHHTTFHSYRGAYEDLAIGYEEGGFCDSATVGALLGACLEAVGKEYLGWKGGQYTMRLDTNVWVENWGDGGHTLLYGVRDIGGYVVLETRFCEWPAMTLEA